MVITLIGDVHGKIEKLQKIHDRLSTPSIQLGDMGCGFLHVPKFGIQHTFLRGNHDNPAVAARHPNYQGEFGYLSQYNMMYIGGAYSIDWEWRQREMNEGAKPCWWDNEQLSDEQLSMALEIYEKNKPRIVVSHECPSQAGLRVLSLMQARLYKMPCSASRTARMMQKMFDIHQPELWVFGHYHFTIQFMLDKTRFLCLNELDTKEIDTENPIAW